jgi:septum formation protein
MTVVLASASPVRRLLLERAGVPVTVAPARIDEAEIRAGLDAEGAAPRAVAEALAEFKARKVSARDPGQLVIGADQVAEIDGVRLDKPEDEAAARAQLDLLQGKTHRLHSAAVVARGGAPIWRHIATVQMIMRPLDDAAIDRYLAAAGPAVLDCVGCYQFEGLGASLFSGYRGDYFAVLGLPLLEVLDVLRANGAIG